MALLLVAAIVAAVLAREGRSPRDRLEDWRLAPSGRRVALLEIGMKNGARPHFRAALGAAALLIAADAYAGVQPQDLVRRAAEATYNLDYEQALALYRQALAIDPESAATHRGIASLAWLQVLFLRGTVTVDDYMGKLASSEIKLEPPPPALAQLFHHHIDRAIELGEQAVRARPSDAGAHYALGAALGLAASYQGSVEGKLLPAFRAARRAFDAHEKVLKLDPSRKEAGLVVGTYRYAVSTLPAPLRWMAYLVGFGGGRDEGIALLEAAAAHPSEAQPDARFALVLVYNRERRYDDALRVVRQLEQSYPGNRLLWLEEGSTALRARRNEEARRALEDGIAKLASDPRPRMPGEEALLADEAGDRPRAVEVFEPASRRAGGGVLTRTRASWGAPAHLRWRWPTWQDRTAARRGYSQAAATLGERSNDPQTRDLAKRLAKNAS